jgi:type II secretory pathway predicted ATPase ExeA
MVLDFYDLREEPFGVTPDPRFFYKSPGHREALASLLYGIRSRRGFMSLIAQPGMGKTTILFELLSQLEDSARTVFLFQTLSQPKTLLHDLLRDLEVSSDGEDIGAMQRKLNEVLMREARHGRRVVVIIDEAQNLEDSALELVRMLSNFETTSYKLMQIILAGQPQLRERLRSPHLAQLRQRLSICSRLHPLGPDETRLYLTHRLRVAGYERRTPLFTPEATALIATYSSGIPRNINNICFNALALGYVLKNSRIGEDVIRESLQDLDLASDERDQPETKPSSFSSVPIEDSKLIISGQQIDWLKRAIICLVLLLPLLWLSGDDRVAAAFNSLPSNQARESSLYLDSRRTDLVERSPGAVPSRLEQVTASSSAHGHETDASAALTSHGSPAKGPAKTGPFFRKTQDPSILWEEVKRQNSDAEVTLAELYIEGTVVPKSCEQAHVLLQAASAKGNVHATDRLRTYEEQCH